MPPTANKTVSWTLRLSHGEDEQLQQLAENQNCSKNQAVRHLIQNVDATTAETIGAGGSTNTPATTDTQSTPTTTETTTVESIPADSPTIETTTGSFPVDELSPSTDVKINPFNGPYDDVVPQSVGKREGVLVACVNFLAEYHERSKMRPQQFEKMARQVFPDYGEQAMQNRLQGLRDKQAVYTNPFLDSQIQNHFDRFQLEGFAKYDIAKREGKLYSDFQDLLGDSFWRSHGEDEVYLTTESYVKKLFNVLSSITNEFVDYRKKDLNDSHDIHEVGRRGTIQKLHLEFSSLVEDRLFEVFGPDHGFSAEDYHGGYVEGIRGDKDASQIERLEPYYDAEHRRVRFDIPAAPSGLDTPDGLFGEELVKEVKKRKQAAEDELEALDAAVRDPSELDDGDAK